MFVTPPDQLRPAGFDKLRTLRDHTAFRGFARAVRLITQMGLLLVATGLLALGTAALVGVFYTVPEFEGREIVHRSSCYVMTQLKRKRLVF